MNSNNIKTNISSIVDYAESLRIESNKLLDEKTRGQKGQFMTPAPLAELLASFFDNLDGDVSILDAGAGVGSLSAALIKRALLEFHPSTIESYTWEIENVLVESLNKTLNNCKEKSIAATIPFEYTINHNDFIQSAYSEITGGRQIKYNKAILNPPYLKISSESLERRTLSELGIETGNLYSCFVSLALLLLEDGGELVAITPRSFCNGPYFNDFRNTLLNGNYLKKIRVFESRTQSFKDDNVLQENVIYHVIKGRPQGSVEISSSRSVTDEQVSVRACDFSDVVEPKNKNKFIHIITSDEQYAISKKMSSLPCKLEDLSLSVSTGRVVDFRSRNLITAEKNNHSVPLIYPFHFKDSLIEWPAEKSKKPDYINQNSESNSLLIPNEIYVLVKRLTSKEEKRRVVAAIYQPLSGYEQVGFDNKTNYFHINGRGLADHLAKGILAYLNSTFVDSYFRQFNGHTQVNASDLRLLRYPSEESLKTIAMQLENYTQDEIDKTVMSVLFSQ